MSRACGRELHKFFNDLYAANNIKVLSKIRPSLSNEQRYLIIGDSERARAHLVSVLTLKLAHWTEAPYVAFGAAHHDPETALDCLRKSESSGNQHAIARKMMTEEMAMDRTIFVRLGGRTDHHCHRLRQFMAQLRLTPMVVRALEGTHRDVHREVKMAPCH